MGKIKLTIDKIKWALGDPDAPWYGSDLVAWVADLVEAYEQQAKPPEFPKDLQIPDEI